MCLRSVLTLLGLTRRPKRLTSTCRLPSCSLPCFQEPGGRALEFCGRTHAEAFHSRQHSARRAAAFAPAAAGPSPFDGTREYVTPEMVLFWQPPSVFSQWTPSLFVVDGVRYLCAEQFMMAEKARLFGDEHSLLQIMITDDPKMHQQLGRTVRGYDQVVWDREKKDVIKRGTYAKFMQNPNMRRHLLGTKDKLLAEASPYDKVWGIGLRANDPAARNRDTWCGQNLLGTALQEVRSRISWESSDPSINQHPMRVAQVV